MSEGGRVADLVRLSDTTLNLADPAADVRGRRVVDADGEEIGDVDDLFVDQEENKVRFLRVASGGLLGIGAQHFLVPAEAVARIEDDRVHIVRNLERLRDVPAYDPELSDNADYYESLYGWWGYGPYWGPASAFVPPPPAPAVDHDRKTGGRD